MVLSIKHNILCIKSTLLFRLSNLLLWRKIRKEKRKGEKETEKREKEKRVIYMCVYIWIESGGDNTHQSKSVLQILKPGFL